MSHSSLRHWHASSVPSPVTRFFKVRTHWFLECFKKFVVYFSVFLVVRPPDVLCLPPSIVSKTPGSRGLKPPAPRCLSLSHCPLPIFRCLAYRRKLTVESDVTG